MDKISANVYLIHESLSYHWYQSRVDQPIWELLEIEVEDILLHSLVTMDSYHQQLTTPK